MQGEDQHPTKVAATAGGETRKVHREHEGATRNTQIWEYNGDQHGRDAHVFLHAQLSHSA